MNNQIDSLSQLNQDMGFTRNNEPSSQPRSYKQKNLENLSRGVEKIPQLSSDSEERERGDHDEWKHSEIKKIFTLYLEFGSQWKLIQTQFAERSSNSIKNRFYTVVRTFLKVLFRQHPEIRKKLPHEIPSKTILKFYQGRQEFIKFKGFGKRILKSVDYNLQSRELKKIAQNNLDDIKILFQLIFNPKPDSKPARPAQKNKNKKVTEKTAKVEQKQIKCEEEPEMKAMRNTDAFYDEAEPVPSMSLPLEQGQEDKSQAGVGQLGFVLLPSTSFFSVMSFNPYFPFY